jgi:hypothetical protein
MLMALAAAAVVAAGQVGVAQATVTPLTCTNGGDGAGSKAILAGTYTFSFLGNNVTGVSPLAGSGSVTLNGGGGVLGGVIRCNQDAEWDSPITGGCYSINSDGTGWLAITTSSVVCGKHDGVDLQLAIVPFINGLIGSEFQFSSDGNSVNSATGFSDAFSGTAFLQIPIFP